MAKQKSKTKNVKRKKHFVNIPITEKTKNKLLRLKRRLARELKQEVSWDFVIQTLLKK